MPAVLRAGRSRPSVGPGPRKTAGTPFAHSSAMTNTLRSLVRSVGILALGSALSAILFGAALTTLGDAPRVVAAGLQALGL